jgi:hypothetical protein
MKKKTIIILSLVSAVLSLIYVIFGYYGINRYIGLHFCSTKSHVKNYSKLEKSDDKARVVLSLTTTPERLHKLKPTISSLLDQTTKVDEIAISIPYGKKYKIPEYLNDIAQIYRYAVNYGDAGNLIPTVLREREGDTKIILVKDNVIYGKDFVETIVDKSKKSPDKAIAVKKLESGRGVLVKPDFFDISVTDYNSKDCCGKWLSKKLLKDVDVIEYGENYKAWN